MVRGLRMMLHPSVELFASRFPAVSVWEANRDGDAAFAIREWVAEQALVARPFMEVDVWRLPPGGHAFLAALRRGANLAAAAEVATAAADFDLDANFELLIVSNIVVGFRSA